MEIPAFLRNKWRDKTSREIFTLAEGAVEIRFPGDLSSESLKDLKDYLDIFLRKASRLNDDPHDTFRINPDGPWPKKVEQASA